jgi:hypothetical protein
MALTDNFRPTLLIGVGGTGIRIAERVYGDALRTEQGKRGRIGVLDFDTDTNDLRRLRAVDHRNQVVLSTPDSIFQMLEKNPEAEQSWFGDRKALSHDILNMTLLDGAAQIRLLTRLGWYHAIKRGGIEGQIGDAIARIGVLNSRERFDGALNVMIIGSLAGASGSGCFMQVALLISQVCRVRNITADIRGLFLLPDVFVRGANLPTDQVRNVLANGYASLKELNAVNNIVTNRGDTTPFTFEYAPGQGLQEGGLPFRSLALIDFENVRGGNLGRSLEAYQRMAARAAFQLIFTPIGQRTASVSVNDARARLAAAAEGTHNLYAGIGVSGVVYPADEMCQYLVLRMATENLGNDWLWLDRSYFERVRRYEEQRRQGSLSAVRPDQGQAYLEDLDILANKDRRTFFAEVYMRLNPRVRDERAGTEAPAPRHLTYLSAILAEINDRFWSRARLAEAKQRAMLDSSQLRNRTAVTDLVRRLEADLTDDLAQIDLNLATVPEDDFVNVLTSADEAAVGEWRDYHLQTHIIKGGPHLVETRAFLYALRRAIKERRDALNVAAARSRLMRAANVFDESRGNEPTERGTPRVIEMTRQAAGRGIFGGMFKGSFEQFQGDYATYYNGSLVAMRAYANQAVELRVLSLLDDEIQGIERCLTGLFLELGAIFARLTQDATVEERRHDPGVGAADGNRYVYADEAAKQATWDALSRRSIGLRLDAEANQTLAAAVYRRYRNDRRDQRLTDFVSLGHLFRQAVVEDFGRRTITGDFRSTYDFSIVEAIRKEADLRKVEWKAHLRNAVDVAGSEAEPFLTLTDASNGQRVIFWAVHPQVRSEINDDETFNALFTFNQGETPLEAEEFSAQELLCVNTRVNLELTHLAKLHPGDGRTNVNVAALGSYARAYRDMTDGLIEAELSPERRAHDFTPHLDASWHRPGALPEIFPELTRAVQQDFARAIVVSSAFGLLKFEREYGRPVAIFSTIGRPGGSPVDLQLAVTNDLWVALAAAAKRAELTRAALRFWQAVSQPHNQTDGSADKLLNALREPGLVESILRLVVVRDDAAAREEQVRRLLTAWIDLLSDGVALVNPNVAQPGRERRLRDEVETARNAAIAKLQQDNVLEETMRAINRTFALAMADQGFMAQV